MGKTRKTDDIAFNRFWSVYPKRIAKLDALKAWRACNPTPEIVEQMIAALAWQTRQPSWVKDGGAFVPYPATWIRAGRWMDEPPAVLGQAVEAVKRVPQAYREYVPLRLRDVDGI